MTANAVSPRVHESQSKKFRLYTTRSGPRYCQIKRASLILEVRFSHRPDLCHVLVADDPDGNDHTDQARRKGDAVRGAIAPQALVAGALTAGIKDAVAVQDRAIDEVKDVGGEDGRERHEAPVLAEAVDAKRLGHNGREDAKEQAVGDTREAGQQEEVGGRGDGQAADLGDGEDEAGHDQTPYATGPELFDEEIGTNA